MVAKRQAVKGSCEGLFGSNKILLKAMLGELRAIWEYREAVARLVLADLRARYKYSSLGFFWSLLNPLLEVGILVVTFGRLLRVFPEPTYPLMVLCGVVPWTAFSSTLADCADSLPANPSIVKRLPTPRQVLPLAKVISNLVHLGMALVVVLALEAFLLGLVGKGLRATLLLLPVIVLLQELLAYGLGLAVATVGAFYRDARFIVQAIVRFWYFLCPIVYPYVEAVERLGAQSFFYFLNPMASVIASYQRIVVEGSLPDMLWVASALGWTFLSLLFGLLIFRRYEWLFPEVL